MTAHLFTCDYCRFETGSLNERLAHKCDPGEQALVAYQRMAAGAPPMDSERWVNEGWSMR